MTIRNLSGGDLTLSPSVTYTSSFWFTLQCPPELRAPPAGRLCAGGRRGRVRARALGPAGVGQEPHQHPLLHLRREPGFVRLLLLQPEHAAQP
ncbi:hypothetical protein ACRAWD_20505 [Caulobacter segnis]